MDAGKGFGCRRSRESGWEQKPVLGGRVGKGGLFLPWLHFLAKAWVLELGSRAMSVGSRHGEGLLQCPRPWSSLSTWNPQKVSTRGGRVVMRSHSSARHLWVQMPPPPARLGRESCILTYESGERCFRPCTLAAPAHVGAPDKRCALPPGAPGMGKRNPGDQQPKEGKGHTCV